MTLPKVSAVIIGRNEGTRLVRCLESVCAASQAGLLHEIIYVDSGSSDHSVETARSMGATTILLDSPRPTAARGRNAGWRAATGCFILFLDGDTILEQRFLAPAMHSLEQKATAVVWGHRRELFPEASVYQRVLDLDWIYAPGETAFCGGDALVRRQVLEQTGGFDETLIAGEEPELCRRIRAQGSRILHLDLPMTAHDLAITRFGQYWSRAVRAGHAFAEVGERFRGSQDAFWDRETTRNRNRALSLVGLGMVSLGASVVLHSVWPLGLCALLLLLLIVRTAQKARWKSDNSLTLLLYGVHSHLQQIPIYAGQLLYLRNRRSGRNAGIVEYKASSRL